MMHNQLVCIHGGVELTIYKVPHPVWHTHISFWGRQAQFTTQETLGAAIVDCGDYEEQMTQQMVITSYYILKGRSFVANLNIGGLMTLGEQTRMRNQAISGPVL